MKQLTLLFIFSIFISCKFTEKPEFTEMTNFNVSQKGFTKMNVSADAVFFNPNDIGYELVETNIDVFVNGQSVGKATQSNRVDILAKENFAIPLNVDLSLSDLNIDIKGLFKNITGSVIDQKINLEFKGDVTLKKAGVPFTVPMVYTHEIGL